MRIEGKLEEIANELSWVLLYFGLGLLVSITITFPTSIRVVILGVVVTESFRTRHLVRNLTKLKELFRSLTNLQSNQSLLRYYCMSCGYEHTKVAFPKCGSKIKKVDF
jgi:hypothetical protein